MIDQLFGILVSLALIGAGLAFGGLAAGMAARLIGAYRASVRSQTWALTPGQITHSETIWVGARSRTPRPTIRYTYQVGGTAYEGQRIIFEYSHVYSHAAATQMMEEYPVGATTTVYFDPQKPQESTLNQAHIGLASGLVVSAMLLLPMFLCLAAGTIGFVDTVGG